MKINIKIDNGLGTSSSQPISIKLPKKDDIPPQNKDSILDKIDTGFDSNNTVYKECPKPKWSSHLSVGNYLSEFKTDQEKEIARNNLEVYSKDEIDTFISNISVDTTAYVTKPEVEDMIQDLDFVQSTAKSSIDYNIPDNLFK